MEFINLKAQYAAYKTEIDEAIANVLSSAQFIMGKEVEALENALARYTGAKYAISCASGTDALLLALLALGIQEGDEVITSPFTFAATAEAIALCKAKIVFADVREGDANIDPALIKKALSPKTKAIIPVSLYGNCADFDAINEIALRRGIAVIEDGCQSFGASYKGAKSGAISAIGTTSFFPSKPLGCYGDGGAVFTSDEALANKIARLRNHGQSRRYEHTEIGLNGRLDAVQAAILNVKLKYFNQELKTRRDLAARYDRSLGDIKRVACDQHSAIAQYTIRVSDRDRAARELGERGIPTAIHYPKPLHLQPAYAYLGYKIGDFPVAETLANEVLSLPFSAFLTDEEQNQVISAVKETCR
ncbi:MAG: DegT/DnrJ/EryC1/StrS family aminotransferase [Helicobacteraceae bacterium]|jgi:UDP-2-acetamido-2-deoxy-ribo-hexuluronate aminotransferase|nr:DegT/DnrJ/EryC1/StrS family aminotransferase [Helicobacteraceae bacterium]